MDKATLPVNMFVADDLFQAAQAVDRGELTDEVKKLVPQESWHIFALPYEQRHEYAKVLIGQMRAYGYTITGNPNEFDFRHHTTN